MIGLQHASVMSMTRRNRDLNFNRIFASNKNINDGEHVNLFCVLILTFQTDILFPDQTKGLLHILPQKMCDSLLIMARKFRPHKTKDDFERLKAQRNESV